MKTVIVTICAIATSILIFAYLLAYLDMGDVKLKTNCFLSHVEPCSDRRLRDPAPPYLRFDLSPRPIWGLTSEQDEII